MTLGKIKGGKNNWAQRWADTQIRKFLPFQKEQKETNGEIDILTMTNKPPFGTWEEIADKMACHDLANWLSHYLYFFSFLFFSYLQLQDGAQESIT